MSRIFTKRGQVASARREVGRKRRTVAGQGRLSQTLGENDPRRHRIEQAAQSHERQYGPEFTVDAQGRTRLRTETDG